MDIFLKNLGGIRRIYISVIEIFKGGCMKIVIRMRCFKI